MGFLNGLHPKSNFLPIILAAEAGAFSVAIARGKGRVSCLPKTTIYSSPQAMKNNHLRKLTLVAPLAAAVTCVGSADAAVLTFDDHPNAVQNTYGDIGNYAGFTFSSTLNWIDTVGSPWNHGAKSGDFTILNRWSGVGTITEASNRDFVFDGIWAKKWATSPESGGNDSLFGTLSGYNNGSLVWTTLTGLNGSFKFFGPQAGAIDELRLGFGNHFLADNLSLNVVNDSSNVSSIPEPGSLLGLAMVLGSGALFRGRRRAL